ncbi:MAG: DUF3313 domain-containing protein [Methylococcales bacterium]
MPTKIKTQMDAPARGWLLLPLPGLCLLLLSACTTTQKAPLTQEGVACGFLGGICTKLTPGGKDQAALRYINPTVRWTQYNKIMIDPVTFWGGESARVSGPDQQLLVNFFHQQLREELGKKFEIVDNPGPGVMKLDVAMLDAEAATPGLRSVSMIIPQAHMLSNLKYLATGTFPFVGGAEGAAKLTDSQTGRMLSAVVDRQIGGGSIEAGFQWQWGDAENAITNWSKRLAEKLSSWTTGTASP